MDEVRSVRFCGREWTLGYRGNQYKRQVQGNINSLMSMPCQVSYFAVSVTLYLFVPRHCTWGISYDCLKPKSIFACATNAALVGFPGSTLLPVSLPLACHFANGTGIFVGLELVP